MRGRRTDGLRTITLREWLREGPFSLALSQGFCCFPALAGALLAIEEALDVPLRHAGKFMPSAASGGAIVAAFVAAGHSVRSLGPRVAALSPSELMDPIGDCGVLRGGLCDGSKTRRALSENLGANTFADLRIDFAASAFRLDRLRLERLDSGDCAAAVVASCAVPGLFAPQRLPRGLYADFAVLLDPCGDFALYRRCRRADACSRWSPATGTRGAGPRRRRRGSRSAASAATLWSCRCASPASHECGLGHTTPRREGAPRGAYLAVSAALDRPLGAGREPRHFRWRPCRPHYRCVFCGSTLYLVTFSKALVGGCGETPRVAIHRRRARAVITEISFKEREREQGRPFNQPHRRPGRPH